MGRKASKGLSTQRAAMFCSFVCSPCCCWYVAPRLTTGLCLCAFSQVLDKDFTLPIGKAKIMRPGKHVTLIAFSKMVGYNLKVAEQLAQEGIEAEVRMGGANGCAMGGQGQGLHVDRLPAEGNSGAEMVVVLLLPRGVWGKIIMY